MKTKNPMILVAQPVRTEDLGNGTIVTWTI